MTAARGVADAFEAFRGVASEVAVSFRRFACAMQPGALDSGPYRLRLRTGGEAEPYTRVRLRDLTVGSLLVLVRHRPRNVARYLHAATARALVLPGDRFYEMLRDREGEVLAVKREHVVMLTVSGYERARARAGEVPVGHVERIARDDFASWEPAA